MRTTLTLDPDVTQLLEQAVHRERRSMKQVVNDALRRALGPSQAADVERYVVEPHVSELAPGIDPSRLNQLVDELETEVDTASLRDIR